jgi:hypothetical protein
MGASNANEGGKTIRRWAGWSLALFIASFLVLTGTAASAFGVLPPPPGAEGAAPGSVGQPTFASTPVTLQLTFTPEVQGCTITSPSQPYVISGDSGLIALSDRPNGSCVTGDWAESIHTDSGGSGVSGEYEVQLSLVIAGSPGNGSSRMVDTAYFELPATSALLSLTILIDLGSNFPPGGVSLLNFIFLTMEGGGA